LIALPGLCLVTKRFEDARSILRDWASHVSEGMIPNRLGTGEPEFNSVDASLWLGPVVHQLVEKTGDLAFALEHCWPAMQEIIDWHLRGTRFDIHVDPADGLLAAGDEGTQLTWMDVLFEGRPVTPRWGKAVEVNALWYNTVCIGLELAQAASDSARVQDLEELAATIQYSFREKFWSKELGYLYDLIRPDFRSDQLRPNQLLALSLPFPLMKNTEALQILGAVQKSLVTPAGLRTLAPTDPDYRGRYEGTLRQRDMAYHQGTVWPWLLAPYVRGLLRFKGAEGRREAKFLLQHLWSLLSESGVGTVSEVHDGDPPHAAGGCFAQAWSVAAVLEIADMLETDRES
jgi:predicted glycogen debranching enzyme